MSKTSRKAGVINDKANLLAMIETLVANGRKEITKKSQLEKYPIGSLISYINKSDMYRKGGFIVKYSDKYFIYVTPDYKHKYRVKYDNIKRMWVGDPTKIEKDLISLKPATNTKTNFPAKIGDTIIYYAKDNFALRRYKNTQKYKRTQEWYNYFH